MSKRSIIPAVGRLPRRPETASTMASQAPFPAGEAPARESGRTLGGERILPREAGQGELGGHRIFRHHQHQPKHDTMSEKTTKTTETAQIPGHEKKIETHTEETRHEPETKVETKKEATEEQPE